MEIAPLLASSIPRLSDGDPRHCWAPRFYSWVSHLLHSHRSADCRYLAIAFAGSALCPHGTGLAALLASSTAGGALTRRLLPAAIIIPIVIGALGWRAFSAGLYSGWSVVSLMIIAMMTLLAGFAIWNGYIVNRGDVERQRAEGVLHRREMELREAERLARMGSWWWDPKTDSCHLVRRTVSYCVARSHAASAHIQRAPRVLHVAEFRATRCGHTKRRPDGSALRARPGDGSRGRRHQVRHRPRGSGARCRWPGRVGARHRPGRYRPQAGRE